MFFGKMKPGAHPLLKVCCTVWWGGFTSSKSPPRNPLCRDGTWIPEIPTRNLSPHREKHERHGSFPYESPSAFPSNWILQCFFQNTLIKLQGEILQSWLLQLDAQIPLRRHLWRVFLYCSHDEQTPVWAPCDLPELPDLAHLSHQHTNTTTHLVQEETRLVVLVCCLVPFAISSHDRIWVSAPASFLPRPGTNVQEHFQPQPQMFVSYSCRYMGLFQS